ncbi:IS3 family transposase [Bifidobacterium longum subsp. longum]
MRRRTRTSRRGSRTWKSRRPAGVEIGNRDRTVIVSMLAGPGHRLRHLLRAAGLAKSTYYHLLSHPAAVTRPDIEPMVAEIFARTPNGCGHRQIRMCLVHEFGVRVSHKSVLKVMRRMGLECRIRRPNPYRKYSSYRDETGARAENLLNRDFTADRPWVKLGTDVTEFRVADGKAYPAPVYDMGSKEIVAWDVSRHPDMAQQRRLLAMLEEKLPEDADPIPHSDMGWQYRHRWWRDRLAGLNIRQSMSRKGNCIDNAATEQVFGHLKDEFHAGREFASYEQFKNELDAYIIHWNTKRRQIRLEGHTPEEFRNMSLTA